MIKYLLEKVEVTKSDSKNNNYLHYLLEREQYEIEILETMLIKGVNCYQVNIESNYPFSLVPKHFSQVDQIYQILQKYNTLKENYFYLLCSAPKINSPLIIKFIENDASKEVSSLCFSHLCRSTPSPHLIIFFLQRKINLVETNGSKPHKSYFNTQKISVYHPTVVRLFKVIFFFFLYLKFYFT